MDSLSAQLEYLRQILIVYGDHSARDVTKVCSACRYFVAPVVNDTFNFATCAYPDALDLVYGTPMSCTTARSNSALCGGAGNWYAD